jgi:uncharacterized protein YbjT (DUF2867 family)
MRVLLTGGTGFIGSRLRAALAARGHEVVVASRTGRAVAGVPGIAIDFTRATAADWRPHLQGMQAVVNAVGIFRETRGQRFRALHTDGTRALFDACVQCAVQRVVQVSALGADEAAATDYHRSKKAGDEALLALPLDARIVQPSLVFGAQGASARVFLGWASLPALPLPAGGRQAVQPVHVDDAVQAIVALLEEAGPAWRGRRVALVGPRPITLADYLQSLRQSLHLPRARSVRVPAAVMGLAARVGDRVPGLLFDSAAWQMLQRGNTAPADDITRLLGHLPREAAAFIPPEHARAERNDARLAWLLPVLRLSVALVWIVTGIVSFGLFPREDSLGLLARAGVPDPLQAPMLYGAAAFDLLLGIATLWPMRRRRWLWALQAALILFYTAVITLRLPEFWLHPYGPVLKNLPMLALLWLLAELEPEGARE